MTQQFQLWYLAKENKTVTENDICTQNVHAVLFTVAKIWKQHKCPSMDKWIKKKRCACVYNGILFSHKKNDTLPFVRKWMDLESIMLSGINEKKTNTVWSFLCQIYMLYI